MKRKVWWQADQQTLFDEPEDSLGDGAPSPNSTPQELDPAGWDPFAGKVHGSLFERRIVHVDMDAFYAAIEERDNPEYRGRALVVGGSPQSRGVVATANYAARRFGIRSAMSCARAYRLCPDALFVRPRFEAYSEASRQVRAIFLRYTSMVEPLSLDEAYLDVTEACARGPSPAMEIAARIRDSIRSELHLTASAGIAPNKMVAKIASDVNKPDGQCVVRPEKVFEFMRGLPVRRIPFVGPRTDDRLGELGYRTCEDLVRAGPGKLTEAVGNGALALWWRAQGIDLSPVSPSRERKSCGEEQTFARDLRTREEMRSELAKIASALWSYVSLKGFSGRTLTLKVKYHDFRCVTRRATSPDVVRGEGALLSLASELLARTDAGRVPVRLLGISLSNLGPLDSSCQRVPTEDERVPDDGAFG